MDTPTHTCKGVTYKCMQVMAYVMVDLMIKDKGGKVNLRMLTTWCNTLSIGS